MDNKFCIPVEKPETCGDCPACDTSDQWCGAMGHMIDVYTPPPADCPIIELPGVEGLRDRIKYLEDGKDFIAKAVWLWLCAPSEQREILFKNLYEYIENGKMPPEQDAIWYSQKEYTELTDKIARLERLNNILRNVITDNDTPPLDRALAAIEACYQNHPDDRLTAFLILRHTVEERINDIKDESEAGNG